MNKINTNEEKNLKYAKYLIEKKKYSKATKILEDLIGTNVSIDASIELAKIYLKDNKHGKARNYLNPIMNRSNKAKYMLSKMEAECKNFDLAKKLFKELSRTENYKNSSYLELAKIEIKEKNPDMARYYLGLLIGTSLEAQSKVLYGDLEQALGNNQEAMKKYKLAIKENNSEEAKYKLALVDLQEGYYIEAEEYLKETLNSRYKYQAIQELITLAIKSDDEDALIAYILIALKNKIALDKKYIFYIANKLGLSYKYIKSSPTTYTDLQIADYDEYVASDYILDKHGESFNKNIDVIKLFNDIKDQLEYENLSDLYQFNDIYDIEYPNIGKEGEKTLRVFTIPNTKQILTMYPLRNK